jgi:hypothetical protein
MEKGNIDISTSLISGFWLWIILIINSDTSNHYDLLDALVIYILN